MNNSKLKFWLNAVMIITLCLLYNQHSTGLVFHEIAGLVLGVVVILHVLVNKDWVIMISKKVFSKDLKTTIRFTYLLNLVLFIDLCFIILSGLLISKIVNPNFRIFSSINWMPIHIFSTSLGLVLVGIHIGLNWRWIKQTGSHLTQLMQLFSSRKPYLKLVSAIILIVGTLVLFGQVSKIVSIAPTIFSNNGSMYEQGKDSLGKPGTLQVTGNNQYSHSRHQGDVQTGNNFRGHDENFSLLQLAENVPSLILYAAALGSMAFYTYLIVRRPKKLL